ncbi:[LysW]-aminoadipate kinase [Streptomyces sp. NPDC046831]|uniref:[LysW]-aminoadipate kinase n=1 Tax=Streptomyces sp. NPDC046831 TaxID=3154805 RepID=UPI0033EC23F8
MPDPLHPPGSLPAPEPATAPDSPAAPLVVKVGGNAAVDLDAVADDVAEYARTGRPVVLVHGGSAEIERLAERLGVPSRTLEFPGGVTTRHTDPATLEVVLLALAGAVKPRLVSRLNAAGAVAVGLTGLDGGTLLARRKRTLRAVVDGRSMVVREDHSGRITKVSTTVLDRLLADGAVPVLSPPALDEEGHPVNVNADRAAAAVAAALGAHALLLLTGAPGVLDDPGDESSVLPECALTADGPVPYTGGGIAIKLAAAREALLAGVSEVRIADGRAARPVSAAVAGAGTRITLDALRGEGEGKR